MTGLLRMSKSWILHSAEGSKIEFTPLFEVSDDGNDVECKGIKMKVAGKSYSLNFINLFQFIYFISNEELRRGLALRYDRRVNRIPYEVMFKLTPEETKEAVVKRRIELPVDELSMAIARNEAWKLMHGVIAKLNTGVKPWELFKGRKK